MKILLFSVTKKDLEMQTFTVPGHGGGGKDTSNSGVRLIHKASGAVGEGRESRSNTQNKKAALVRLANHPKFKLWHKLKCAELMTGKTIDQIVDEQMQPENLKIEVLNAQQTSNSTS